jgi:hypothetical protein
MISTDMAVCVNKEGLGHVVNLTSTSVPPTLVAMAAHALNLKLENTSVNALQSGPVTTAKLM